MCLADLSRDPRGQMTDCFAIASSRRAMRADRLPKARVCLSVMAATPQVIASVALASQGQRADCARSVIKGHTRVCLGLETVRFAPPAHFQTRLVRLLSTCAGPAPPRPALTARLDPQRPKDRCARVATIAQAAPATCRSAPPLWAGTALPAPAMQQEWHALLAITAWGGHMKHVSVLEGST